MAEKIPRELEELLLKGDAKPLAELYRRQAWCARAERGRLTMAEKIPRELAELLAKVDAKSLVERYRRRAVVAEYWWLGMEFRIAGRRTPLADAAKKIREKHLVSGRTLQRWVHKTRDVDPIRWLTIIALRGNPGQEHPDDDHADSAKRKAAVSEWGHALAGFELGEPGTRGERAKAVAVKYGISVQTLYRWSRTARTQGRSALVDGRRLRPSVVTPPGV